MDKYTILQFCAGDILHSTNSTHNITLLQHRDSSTYKVATTLRSVVPTYATVESNALFSQIQQLLTEHNSDRSVEKSVIYITFKTSINANTSIFDNKNMGSTAEELYKKGLTIQYSNGQCVHYVASERSSSMAKKCTLLFVDATIAMQLDQRILLGLDLAGQYPLSKLQAYKGLMLSQGISVGTAKSLGLNASSVIVVPDYKVSYPDTDYITIKEHPDNGWEKVQGHHSNDNKTIDTLLAPYDGVGLIDQAFAKSINTLYGYTKDPHNISKYNKSSSYQIRMPFVKGMLHSCNFNHFFAKHIGNGKITDCFGTQHDYNNVKIILTKSQFKLLSIIKADQFASYIGNSDIWQYYWDRVHQYQHQLFITEIDSPRKSGYIHTNPQLLSTPNMSYRQFCRLKSNTANLYRQLASSHTVQVDYAQHSSIDNILDDQLGRGNTTTTIGKLVAKNHLFTHYKPIRTQLADAACSIKTSYAKGKFVVRGEYRYLSGDLLQLLYDIIGRPCPPSQKLDNYTFYAPASDMCINNQPYVLLRNPHLTRNEDGMLLAGTYAEDSERQWLFGHLQMVIMVNASSTISDRLGGADYDGDRVAIVADDTYIQAVQTHHEQIAENGRVIYRNRYPLLLIPSQPPHMAPITIDNNLDIVKRTFSLNIGQYSNMATKHAINAYNVNADIPEKIRNNCADNAQTISILTQLEIDSAKSGANIVIPHRMQFVVGEDLYDASPLLQYIKDVERCSYTDGDMLVNDAMPNLAYLPYLCKLLDNNLETEYILPIPHHTSTPHHLHAQLFDIDTDTIDDQLMQEVQQLYTEYNGALRSMRAHRDTSTNIYLDAIADILWLQGKANIDSAVLDNIHTTIARLNFKQLIQLIQSIQSHQWHFMPMQGRIQLLGDYHLQCLADNGDTCAVLCDFAQGGYMLLYYFLQHCISNSLYSKTAHNIIELDDEQQQQENLTVTQRKQRLIAEYLQKLLHIFANCDDAVRHALRYCIANKQLQDSNFTWELLGEYMIDYAKENSNA